MNTTKTIESFINEKLGNFILYLDKNIPQNTFSSEIQTLKQDFKQLCQYAEMISRYTLVCNTEEVAVKNKVKIGQKYLEEEKIANILISKGIVTIENISMLDGGNFVATVKRYIEMLVHILC